MKKVILMTAALALAGTMMAQEMVSETVAVEEIPSASRSNWFISAGAGAQVYFGDHDRQCRFGDRIAPNLDIAVGKWITPGIGMRLMYTGLYAKGATQNGVFQSGGPIKGKPWSGYYLNESKFNFMDLHVDVMFDLCNLIGGWNPDRIYSCIPYGGVGFAYIYDKPHNKSITANVGILNAFHVSRAFDVNLDIRATAFQDGFDGARGRREFEGLLSASVGLTYKFAPRGWYKEKEIVTVYQYDNSAINELRAQVNDLVSKNEKLEGDIARGKNVNRNTVKVVGADYLIYFPINVSSLNDADRAQLDFCAKAIKEGPSDVKYTIVGYADKATGSAEVNEILSRKRAESVRDCLVNEFGVNPAQLNITWKGGVGNMFYDDPALSRVVIITPKN